MTLHVKKFAAMAGEIGGEVAFETAHEPGVQGFMGLLLSTTEIP
jgi:hypothetical protein